jgi:hypothetical protein
MARLQTYEWLSCVSNSFEHSLPSSPAVIASFSLNPLSNIRRTVLQLDAIRLAMRQEIHSFSIYKCDVRQIQRKIAIGRLQGEQPLQLCNVLELDSAAQGEDDLSIC